MNELKYVLIRSVNAGVFTGYLVSQNCNEVELQDAIRIWFWSGAATLSQLAEEGVKNPENCKFAMPVKKIIILGVCEIIDISADAEINIRGVRPWKV